MGIKVTVNISNEDYEFLKKQYEKNKAKFGDISLEEFIDKSINIAIKSHIQFLNMNNQMIDIFSDFNLNGLDGLNKSAQDSINKIDDLVNKIFQDNSKKANKDSNNNKNNNDSKTNSNRNKIN